MTSTTTASPSALAPDPSTEALQELLRLQRDAFLAEGPPSAAVRRDRIDRLTLAVLENADELAQALNEDFGNRPVQSSYTSDILGALPDVAETLENLDAWMAPTEIAGTAEKGMATIIQHRPKGVVGVIGPWNFPVNLVFQPAMEALAAGNRVMIKFSEIPSRTAEVFAEAVARHFDPSEVAVVRGGVDTSAAFSALEFDHLFFTGSPGVGRVVASAAGKNLVPVTLELGGKNPVVVAPDADIATAAERIAGARMMNGGQLCLCPDYVFVPRGTVDQFVSDYRASVTTYFPDYLSNPDVTTVINPANFARVNALVDDAETHGATVLRFDTADASPLPDSATRRIPPTMVLGVTDEMRIAHEEVFGPVIGVMPYDDVRETIEWVRSKPHPLAAYWYGEDSADFQEFLRLTTSGGLTRNDMALHFTIPGTPFGGVGQSGSGAYHGKVGFDTFSHHRTITQSVLPFGVAVKASPPFAPETVDGLRQAARSQADAIRARLASRD